MVALSEIISALRPSSAFTIDIDGKLNWLDTTTLPPTQDLIDAKRREMVIERMWENIKTERDLRIASGVKVGNYWFHTDVKSQIQQLGLVGMGPNMPKNLMWKTMSGDFVEMTPTLASQIFMSSAINEQTIFAIAEQHKAAMSVSADPENYNYKIGWPMTFDEMPKPVPDPVPVFEGNTEPTANTDVV